VKVQTSEHGFRYTVLDTGRIVWFQDALREAEAGKAKVSRWLSRAVKLIGGEYGDLDEERVEWFLDDLEMLIRAHREEAEKRTGRRSAEERIALLRNTTGRTPEEAEAFRSKATELERRLTEGG
jgi:polyhydroxyalkanoate synthesis regulator phasin